jgi:hypothetical protein
MSTDRLSLVFTFKSTLLSALWVVLIPASASAFPDYCEIQNQYSTQTGVLSRRTVTARAELDFSEAQDGVIALNATSLKIDGIPQLPQSLSYTLNEMVIHLERNVDREMRANHIYVSSPLGSAVFQLAGGALIEKLMEFRLEDEKRLEGIDPQQLTLSQTFRVLGFTAEIRQAALRVLQSDCALSRGSSGARLLLGVIRRVDMSAPLQVPDLGCPPCSLEAAPFGSP